MWKVLCLTLTVCVVLGTVGPADAAKILMFPIQNGAMSRLVDMIKISGLLAEQGHDITFVVNSYDRPRAQPLENVTTILEFPYPEGAMHGMNMFMTDKEMAEIGEDMSKTMWLLIEMSQQVCEELLTRNTTVQDIFATEFDLIILDIFESCSHLIAAHLDVPVITFNSVSYTFHDPYFPTLLAINPSPISLRSDKMTFMERVTNFIEHVLGLYLNYLVPVLMEDIARRYNVTMARDIRSIIGNNIVLQNSDLSFDYPRPLLQNIVLIGGWHVNPAKPLPAKMESFVSGSGEHGTVLVSFGTAIKLIDKDRVESIARVFSKFPQRFI